MPDASGEGGVGTVLRYQNGNQARAEMGAYGRRLMPITRGVEASSGGTPKSLTRHLRAA